MSSTKRTDYYDIIFNSALDIKRAFDEVGTEDPKDNWIKSVGLLLFVVANEWERQDRRLPDTLMDAATEVAQQWEDMVVAQSVEDVEVLPPKVET